VSGPGGPAKQRDGAERAETDAGRSGASVSDLSAIGAPRLEIINPDATDEEIAAIVAVLSSLGGDPPVTERPRSTWAAYGRRTRPALRPGPGAWRTSGLPR